MFHNVTYNKVSVVHCLYFKFKRVAMFFFNKYIVYHSLKIHFVFLSNSEDPEKSPLSSISSGSSLFTNLA